MNNMSTTTGNNIFQPLYKYDSKRRVRVWQISVDLDEVIMQSGLKDGKLTTKRYTASPKNVGKVNETSGSEQALKEAQARWEKQIRQDDYAEDVGDSGHQLRPMLAHDYLKVPYRASFPCYGQAKLDGVRGLAYLEDGDVKIMTRKGEFYKVTTQMRNQIRALISQIAEDNSLSVDDVVLDGEYYIHGTPLQDIVGAAKKVKPLTEELEFHIFDCIIKSNLQLHFSVRHRLVSLAISKLNTDRTDPRLYLLKRVEYVKLANLEQAEAYLDKLILEDYEGLMLRQEDVYEQRRSYSLIKYKKFQDAEFVILGAEEDKDGGVVWTVIVDLKKSIICKVRPMGILEQRQEWFKEADKYIDKLLKVKFQGYNKYGNLSFPVGVELDRTDG